MRMNLDHVASGHFVLKRDVHCEFDYWPLAISMLTPRKTHLDHVAIGGETLIASSIIGQIWQ